MAGDHTGGLRLYVTGWGGAGRGGEGREHPGRAFLSRWPCTVAGRSGRRPLGLCAAHAQRTCGDERESAPGAMMFLQLLANLLFI